MCAISFVGALSAITSLSVGRVKREPHNLLWRIVDDGVRASTYPLRRRGSLFGLAKDIGNQALQYFVEAGE